MTSQLGRIGRTDDDVTVYSVGRVCAKLERHRIHLIGSGKSSCSQAGELNLVRVVVHKMGTEKLKRASQGGCLAGRLELMMTLDKEANVDRQSQQTQNCCQRDEQRKS